MLRFLGGHYAEQLTRARSSGKVFAGFVGLVFGVLAAQRGEYGDQRGRRRHLHDVARWRPAAPVHAAEQPRRAALAAAARRGSAGA